MSTELSNGKTAHAEPQQQTWVVPRAQIREEEDRYLLVLEMPGVTKEGLDVTVEHHELTITGHRSDEPLKGESLYQESRKSDYRRVFDLDPSIDTDKISVKIEQGVATLALPKSESIKPRKISVSD
ncbi:MAG TPA: Hsp20/alpha crystallin family protein [Chthoniobacteraceae bacterium]|nr:Hsp20/alpha crystallin family protein [Chthoniobacteraceae bacterium]